MPNLYFRWRSPCSVCLAWYRRLSRNVRSPGSVSGSISTGQVVRSLLGQSVDSLREPEVELGQAALAVGRENQAHFVVADVDIGMVLFFFGHFRDPIYKIDRISKIIKLKRAFDVLFLQLPLGYFFHALFQLARFDQVSHNRTTSNIRNLFCNRENRTAFWSARTCPRFGTRRSRDGVTL